MYVHNHSMGQWKSLVCDNGHLLPNFVYKNNKGFGKTAHMRSLAWALAVKYWNLTSGTISIFK